MTQSTKPVASPATTVGAGCTALGTTAYASAWRSLRPMAGARLAAPRWLAFPWRGPAGCEDAAGPGDPPVADVQVAVGEGHPRADPLDVDGGGEQIAWDSAAGEVDGQGRGGQQQRR